MATKRKVRKPKETEYITLGHTDKERRNNLLLNASRGVGKVRQDGDNVVIRLGSESYGLLFYTVLNAKIHPNGSV